MRRKTAVVFDSEVFNKLRDRAIGPGDMNGLVGRGRGEGVTNCRASSGPSSLVCTNRSSSDLGIATFKAKYHHSNDFYACRHFE